MRRDNRTIFGALGRHPVHPFPARMAPEIVCRFINDSKKPMRILDPMMGSGTVVALAQSKQHHAFGVDIDPLAALVASVWTKSVDPSQCRKKALDALKRAILINELLSASKAYPRAATDETKRFVRYWFSISSRKQLSSLSFAISRIRDRDVRNVLWCAFSRLIITKNAGASLARDLAHSRPHRAYDKAPIEPFAKFLDSVEYVLKNCLVKNRRCNGPAANVRNGDARSLPLRAASIDLVVTSPPYLNAIDYIRCSKFSLVWMGFDIAALSTLRSQSVGTEVGREMSDDQQIADILRKLHVGALGPRKIRLISAYIDDMRQAISEVARVLVPEGRAFYVVGENVVEGVHVKNAKILIALAKELGLLLEKKFVRVLPPNRRYLPPPRLKNKASFDSRMRNEVILCFRKLPS